MPRTRVLFPLLETPEYRPYAPIVDQCAQELLEGHAATPDLDALVLERPGPTEFTFAPKAEVASLLHEIAESWETKPAAALRELASMFVGSERPEPGCYVIVVSRRGCVMLWLPTKTCADAWAHSVAMAIGELRGFTSTSFGPLAPLGLGYAVRSPTCRTCAAWASALREAKIPLVGRVDPEPSPSDGEVCFACRTEAAAAERHAADLYGLTADAVARLCSPAAVLDAVWDEEDFERARDE